MKICIPIQAKSMKEAKKALILAKKHADMAEIWLDHIKDLDIADLLKNKPLPVICVCKKLVENGRFKGTNKELIETLSDALMHGADFIDIPESITKKTKNKKKKFPLIRGLGGSRKKTKIIISYHNFKKTPSLSALLKKAEEMKKRGADIVKISVMSKSYSDTVSVIVLAKHLQIKKIPHIIIAMGKKGVLSRILTPTLGGTIMFAPISVTKSSASGQLTVEELKDAWSLIEK